ncbi:MAG: hypothetical protein QXI58_00820 [Candidatus Micrarchaeia archaeon]
MTEKKLLRLLKMAEQEANDTWDELVKIAKKKGKKMKIKEKEIAALLKGLKKKSQAEGAQQVAQVTKAGKKVIEFLKKHWPIGLAAGLGVAGGYGLGALSKKKKSQAEGAQQVAQVTKAGKKVIEFLKKYWPIGLAAGLGVAGGYGLGTLRKKKK